MTLLSNIRNFNYRYIIDIMQLPPLGLNLGCRPFVLYMVASSKAHFKSPGTIFDFFQNLLLCNLWLHYARHRSINYRSLITRSTAPNP